MVTLSIFRHLLSDHKSLREYIHCHTVSFDDIKRRLLLLERLENRHIPDHFYRMNQKRSFNDISTISDILTNGLSSLADEYLEMRGNRIYVKQNKQNQWQELLTYISPLILQAAFLFKQRPLLYDNLHEFTIYYETYIIPNFIYTALPHPYIPQLEHYITHQNGLHDLHMHLNGTTETDIVWQSLLFNPQEFSVREAKAKEQFEQENRDEFILSSYDILYRARDLRSRIFKRIYSHTEECFKDTYPSPYHPLINIFSKHEDHPERWLPLEGLMYVMTFTQLSEHKNEYLSNLFHQYLLIQGSFNKILVQQTHQNGFEQFQKITLNEFRSDCEKKYLARFLQLHGNECRNIKYLEGRFAPKNSQLKNEILLKNIIGGWEKLLLSHPNSTTAKPELKLIAHFIKEADKKPDQFVRHKKLRKENWEKAFVLGLMIQNRSPHLRNFVGVDAAASEFDTPPEVFAPIFRFLRRKGVNHFTYHAGEDFYHIIGGLRAIFEAVEFNQLRCGDRIGHGTAMGVSPKMWIDCIGDVIFIKQGDYLDDLVFVYHLINKQNDPSLKDLLLTIENKISNLCFQIYNKIYPLQAIINAWHLRKYCPMHLFAEDENEANLNINFNRNEWIAITKDIAPPINKKSEVIEILKNYHSVEFRDSYEEIIEINTRDIFDIEQIEALQRMMLKLLHEKEIVIETLPTSNVRIGIHHNFQTYHLWNWFKWQKEGYSIPPIVIGTDDAGIFSTNIYNEFSNIYCQLTSSCKMTHTEAMQAIERLDKNGQIYNFKN